LDLPEGWSLPNTRKCPADRFGPVAGDTCGDQSVDDFDLFGSEAGHHRHNGSRLEGDGARAIESDRAANVSVTNDELDGPDVGESVEFTPQLPQGRAVLAEEGLKIARGLLSIRRCIEMDATHDLAGLDLGVVTVLQKRDKGDRSVRKTVPQDPLELLSKVFGVSVIQGRYLLLSGNYSNLSNS
jgi:hypothetical protein